MIDLITEAFYINCDIFLNKLNVTKYDFGVFSRGGIKNSQFFKILA